jgi:hypothetical protein
MWIKPGPKVRKKSNKAPKTPNFGMRAPCPCSRKKKKKKSKRGKFSGDRLGE